nr:hypothetical protein [Amycolatopsis sulphurea]
MHRDQVGVECGVERAVQVRVPQQRLVRMRGFQVGESPFAEKPVRAVEEPGCHDGISAHRLDRGQYAPVLEQAQRQRLQHVAPVEFRKVCGPSEQHRRHLERRERVRGAGAADRTTDDHDVGLP